MLAHKKSSFLTFPRNFVLHQMTEMTIHRSLVLKFSCSFGFQTELLFFPPHPLTVCNLEFSITWFQFLLCVIPTKTFRIDVFEMTTSRRCYVMFGMLVNFMLIFNSSSNNVGEKVSDRIKTANMQLFPGNVAT